MFCNNFSQHLESLFKDTEKNIYIKKQLNNGDKSRRRANLLRPSSPPVVLSRDINNIITKMINNNHQYNPSTATDMKELSKMLDYDSSKCSSQTTLITSIFERMDQQSRVIELLEKMVHDQNEEIRRMKDEQNEMSHLMRNIGAQSTGLEIHSKLELIEKELWAEIRNIKHSMHNPKHFYGNHQQHSSSKRNDQAVLPLQSRIIEDKTKHKASLHKELDSLKSRIESVEYKVNSSKSDMENVNKKYDKVELDISDMMINQRNLEDITERGENLLQNLNKELQELYSSLGMMDILDVEGKVASSNRDKITANDDFDENDNITIERNSIIDLVDSPTNTMSLLSNNDDNFSFNSSMENFEENNEKHTSLLDDDDDDEIRKFINSVNDGLFLEKHGRNSLINLIKLSDDSDFDDILENNYR